MSELRQNLATKEWFIIATDRAKRPSDFINSERERDSVEFSKNCPFCPGNENMTPNSLYEIEKNGKWFIRSVPNKYSALMPVGNRERERRGIYRKMRGVGYHEVIIESSIHNDNYHKMSIEHIEKILSTYISRYRAIISDERIEMIIIFKNYGISAGSSLSHPHSQLIAAPMVPLSMRSVLQAARDYYDDTGECAYCTMISEEVREKARIITQNNSFVCFCPYASGTPFESWIVPFRHTGSFGDINRIERRDLAIIMKDIFSRYYFGLKDPDFNFVIKTPPRDESNDRCFHWYIQILPKITQRAGFELGSGILINVTVPEANAEFLRNINIEEYQVKELEAEVLSSN